MEVRSGMTTVGTDLVVVLQDLQAQVVTFSGHNAVLQIQKVQAKAATLRDRNNTLQAQVQAQAVAMSSPDSHSYCL